MIPVSLSIFIIVFFRKKLNLVYISLMKQKMTDKFSGDNPEHLDTVQKENTVSNVDQNNVILHKKDDNAETDNTTGDNIEGSIEEAEQFEDSDSEDGFVDALDELVKNNEASNASRHSKTVESLRTEQIKPDSERNLDETESDQENDEAEKIITDEEALKELEESMTEDQKLVSYLWKKDNYQVCNRCCYKHMLSNRTYTYACFYEDIPFWNTINILTLEHNSNISGQEYI